MTEREDSYIAGTILGGKAAAATNKKRYGADFYSRIGSKGGKAGNTGGFASPVLCDCEYTEDLHKLAECAGSKGGKISKRGKYSE